MSLLSLFLSLFLSSSSHRSVLRTTCLLPYFKRRVGVLGIGFAGRGTISIYLLLRGKESSCSRRRRRRRRENFLRGHCEGRSRKRSRRKPYFIFFFSWGFPISVCLLLPAAWSSSSLLHPKGKQAFLPLSKSKKEKFICGQSLTVYTLNEKQSLFPARFNEHGALSYKRLWKDRRKWIFGFFIANFPRSLKQLKFKKKMSLVCGSNFLEK